MNVVCAPPMLPAQCAGLSAERHVACPVQLENALLAKADEEAVLEQQDGLQAALSANTSVVGNALDTKADTAQVVPAAQLLLSS